MREDAVRGNKKKTVLVVEDETVNRELLQFMLADEYNVLTAVDGVEGWETVILQPGRISLILLDIMMPRMNGLQLLEKLKKERLTAHIPVIMLTSERGAELQALQLGAMDFIPKPFDVPEIIQARIRRIIEFVESKSLLQDVEHDGLTGLYNEDFFVEYCRRELQHDTTRALDMIAVDINQFHLISDAGGPEYANKVLQAVAEGIQAAVTGNFYLAGRRDMDCFLLLTEHMEDHGVILRWIYGQLGQVEKKTDISLRMGVYANVDRSMSVESMVEAAASACDAPQEGEEKAVRYYDESRHRQEITNDRMITEIDQALREKQFAVYYQPKYFVRGEKPILYSAEALVRWRHPELGFIPPNQFVSLFEGNGLITKLDEYVWRETARQIRDWKDRLGVSLPVSVNVSRMDFFTPGLVEKLLGIVEENGIGIEDLILEVTESAYAEDVEHVISLVSQLREKGFKIEMDDFGSGYSSLSMVTAMPLDAMKIDMKFVQGLVNNKVGYELVELVIRMAKSLSVPAIVEGVEDEQQYKLMKQAGCDVIQGYYFAKPVAAAEFEAILLQEKGVQA